MKNLIKMASLFAVGALAGCSNSYEEPEEFIEHYLVDKLNDDLEEVMEKWGYEEFEVRSAHISASYYPGVENVCGILNLIPEDGKNFYKVSNEKKHRMDCFVSYRWNMYGDEEVKKHIRKVKDMEPKAFFRIPAPFAVEVRGARRLKKNGCYEPIRIDKGVRAKLWNISNLGAYMKPVDIYFLAESEMKKNKNFYVADSQEFLRAKKNYVNRVTQMNETLEKMYEISRKMNALDRNLSGKKFEDVKKALRDKSEDKTKTVWLNEEERRKAAIKRARALMKEKNDGGLRELFDEYSRLREELLRI